jgi:hypothetical protein
MGGIEIAGKFGPESFILEQVGRRHPFAASCFRAQSLTIELADRDVVPALQTTTK